MALFPPVQRGLWCQGIIHPDKRSVHERQAPHERAALNGPGANSLSRGRPIDDGSEDEQVSACARRLADTQVYRQIRCSRCERRVARHNQAGSGIAEKGNRMSYRIVIAGLAAAIVVACVATEAFAFRGGGRAGGVHAGGVRAGAVGVRAGGAYRGGAYRGAAYRGAYRGGAYRGAYVRRGVGAAAVGAAAVGAAGYYGTAQCGYYPYPPCY